MGNPQKNVMCGLKKIKIKPVSVKHCHVREFGNGTTRVSVCDLCDQEFPMRKHLELHKQFCKDIFFIRFKCMNYL